MEKRKKVKDQEKEQKKQEKKLKIIRNEITREYDEVQEDLLNFKDSDRESLIDYLENDLRKKLVDTPTRLVNESNEFLEIQI